MKRIVTVTQSVEVEIDENKFTESFLEEYRQLFSDLDIEGHIENLAQLHARGLADSYTNCIEGYGSPGDMGISMSVLWQEEEIDA